MWWLFELKLNSNTFRSPSRVTSILSWVCTDGCRIAAITKIWATGFWYKMLKTSTGSVFPKHPSTGTFPFNLVYWAFKLSRGRYPYSRVSRREQLNCIYLAYPFFRIHQISSDINENINYFFFKMRFCRDLLMAVSKCLLSSNLVSFRCSQTVLSSIVG
jgi:hypothetical protein